MKRKLMILAIWAIAIGLLAFYAGTRVSAASEPQKNTGDSIQDLKARIGKLERQVAALQAQIKELTAKASTRVLTIPEPHDSQGDKLPPGATEHEFNGMKYWSIPIKGNQ